MLASRLKVIRGRRGLTVQELAKLCVEQGASDLTATTIYNIESGRPDDSGKRRRRVTVEELMALATVLEVAPVHLLIPLDDNEAYEVTPGREVSAVVMRDFIRGVEPLDGMDFRRFFAEVPEKEFLKVAYEGGRRTASVERRGDDGEG